jgi:hypothetical protein
MGNCPRCGAPLTPGVAFCTNCGAQVAASQPFAPPAANYPPPPPPPPGNAYPPPQGNAYPAPQGNAYPAPQGNAYAPPPPASAYPPPPPGGYPPPPPGYGGYAPPPPAAKKGGSTVLLVVLGVLGLGVLLVIGGVWYMVHRVAAKIHDVASQIQDEPGGSDAPVGDVCRFLSKSDVSAAIGTEIVETKSDAGTCHYMAVGTPSSMTMKHIGASSKEVATRNGSDPKQAEDASKMLGQMMSGLGADKAGDATDKTSVLDMKVSSSGGKAQLRIQNAIFGKMLTAQMGAAQHPDVGDEALIVGNNLMLVRKGDAFFQFTFTQCPCGSDAVVALAKKAVAAYD